jgi:hypothetical protein
MKTFAVVALSLLACVFATGSFAKDPAKKKKEIKDVPLPDVVVDEAAIAVLKPYDKNGDMTIDKDEFVALAADYKKNPAGPLKQFDRNKDGTLDDFVDRAGINNTLGTVAAKKQRDEQEAKRQERVAKQKAAEEKGKK